MSKIAEEKIEMVLNSFIGPFIDAALEAKESGDMCTARALEKKAVSLYRSMPHITYVESLDKRNYRKIYENSFSHQRDRMDECGRASLTSYKRRG